MEVKNVRIGLISYNTYSIDVSVEIGYIRILMKGHITQG